MIMCIYICTYIYLFREGDISIHICIYIYIYSTLGLNGENPPVFVMFRAICSELCEGGNSIKQPVYRRGM